jgi:hypothetical protein
MKSFLRENPTIAFGLGLPLLLVVVFLLISGIPTLLVAPPQHDVLYATEYYGNPQGVQITVVNQRVQVVYQGTTQGHPQPRLWRYSPKTGAVKEIAIIPPPELPPAGTPATTPEAASKITPIEVQDVVGLTVDSSSIAPDGYEFKVGGEGYSDGIFTGLFTFSRHRNAAVLTKRGRSIRLPLANDRYYGHYPRFIGWVVSP